MMKKSVYSIVRKINLWRTTRDYIFITLGMAIYAFGFCAFILPQKVVIGRQRLILSSDIYTFLVY